MKFANKIEKSLIIRIFVYKTYKQMRDLITIGQNQAKLKNTFDSKSAM